MREIKFRAWDKISEDVFEAVSIDFEREIVVLKKESYTTFACLSEVEFMQFTGLYDKNSKEIYEGDILQGTYYFRGTGWYDEGEGEYFINSEVVFKKGKYTCQGFDLDIIASDVEVIGNIYENPELIE